MNGGGEIGHPVCALAFYFLCILFITMPMFFDHQTSFVYFLDACSHDGSLSLSLFRLEKQECF